MLECKSACQKEGDSNCKFVLIKRQLTLPLGLQCQLSSPAGSRQEQSEDVFSRIHPPPAQLCIEGEAWGLEGIWTSSQVPGGCIVPQKAALLRASQQCSTQQKASGENLVSVDPCALHGRLQEKSKWAAGMCLEMSV